MGEYSDFMEHDEVRADEIGMGAERVLAFSTMIKFSTFSTSKFICLVKHGL